MVVFRCIAAAALGALLANAGQIPVAAQVKPQGAALPSHTAEGVEEGHPDLAPRIVGLLVELAANAESISDPDLKLYCQLEAAALLWPREPDRARSIYEGVFDGLALSISPSAAERASAAKRISTLITDVARRDPVLAERFARRLAADGDEQAETLLDAATEMIPNDPARAASLGRLALSSGVTPSAIRFLAELRSVDPVRADGLFAAAATSVLRSADIRLDDIGMLTAYLTAAGTRAEGVQPDVMRVFLQVALQVIGATPLDSTDASAAYFLGRQLAPFYAKYLPDQIPELERRIAVLSQSDGFARAQSSPAATGTSSPDTQRAQLAAAAVEQGDFAAAHKAASAIEDDSLRSRIYAQAALRLVKLGRLDEVGSEIDRVPDPARRASLLIHLAAGAQGRGDTVRAVEALDEAKREAERVDPTGARVQVFFAISAAFVEIDPLRAFETLRAAIENANRATRDLAPAALAPKSLNFDATFARLARLDFDGAWLLAGQFDGRGPRLLAELAVCRGGLGESGDDGMEFF